MVLITGIFSFVQENKETEVRKEFDRLIPEKATVIRYSGRINYNALLNYNASIDFRRFAYGKLKNSIFF